MAFVIPSLMTLGLASFIIYSIVSRFSTYAIFILSIVVLCIILYNNITTFGNEYKFFIDFFDTFGGRLLFIIIIGGVAFVVLGFISKLDIVKVQALKVFANSKPITNTPIEKILQIERQL